MSICSLEFQASGVSVQGRGTAFETLGSVANPDCGSAILSQALDVLSDALILTDRLSRVRHINRSARTILSEGSLAIRNGLLCARTTEETHVLQKLISTQGRAAKDAGHFRTNGSSGRGGLVLTVITAQNMPPEEPDAGSVLVVAHELNRAQIPSPCVISSFFGLTPAEARLAYEMAMGDGLGACARRLGITPNTARTHLKHVFEKTGTRRQAELLRLLLSCGFSLADWSSTATNTKLREAGLRRA